MKERKGNNASWTPFASLAFPSPLQYFKNGHLLFPQLFLSFHQDAFTGSLTMESITWRQIGWVNQPISFPFKTKRKPSKTLGLLRILYFCVQSTLDCMRWLCIGEVRLYLSPLLVCHTSCVRYRHTEQKSGLPIGITPPTNQRGGATNLNESPQI